MTGSGKTEVYLRAAEAALARGRSCILLVPEIALVPALAREVEQRFGEELAILHSGLGTGERHQEWERVRRGEARVVLGPRSALFAPVAGPRPDRGRRGAGHLLQAGDRCRATTPATWRWCAAGTPAPPPCSSPPRPSLESRYNVERGKLELLRLTERAGQGTLPRGHPRRPAAGGLVERPGEVHFSERLRQEITGAAGRRRADHPAAQPPRLRADAPLPRLRRGPPLPGLRPAAHLPPPRRAGCSATTAARRSRRPRAARAARRRPSSRSAPAPSGWRRRFAELFPEATVDVLDRDTARRPGGAAAILERLRPRRGPGAHRHADGLQGPSLPGRRR